MTGFISQIRDTAVNKIEKKNFCNYGFHSILWRERDKKKTNKYIVYCKIISAIEKNK